STFNYYESVLFDHSRRRPLHWQRSAAAFAGTAYRAGPDAAHTNDMGRCRERRRGGRRECSRRKLVRRRYHCQFHHRSIWYPKRENLRREVRTRWIAELAEDLEWDD